MEAAPVEKVRESRDKLRGAKTRKMNHCHKRIRHRDTVPEARHKQDGDGQN